MTIALVATAVVVAALLFEICLPWIDRQLDARRHRRALRASGAADPPGYDTGRGRRAAPPPAVAGGRCGPRAPRTPRRTIPDGSGAPSSAPVSCSSPA